MAKFIVTSELANLIRSSRIQYKITSKDLANHIGKSPSYMTKLEKGEIKTINERDLTDIFMYLFKEDDLKENDREDLFFEKLDAIYSNLEMMLSKEEIEKQLWMDTYDTVKRRIPIPFEMIDDVCARMDKIGLSVSILCQRINANEAIYPRVKNSDLYPFNEWQAIVNNHVFELVFIKMKISEEDLYSILQHEVEKTNYVTLKAIAYYLMKIEQFGDVTEIPESDNDRLNHQATAYLNSYKVFSLYDKWLLTRKARSEEEKNELLSTFDIENQKLLNRILACYKSYSDFDISDSNRRLEQYAINLKADTGFMMALMSLKYDEISSYSVSQKKEFLKGVKNLLDHYKGHEETRKVERYDIEG